MYQAKFQVSFTDSRNEEIRKHKALPLDWRGLLLLSELFSSSSLSTGKTHNLLMIAVY